MTTDLLKRVLMSRVSDVVPTPTPLDPAPELSALFGRPALLKREDLTPVFSFKVRGAYNKISGLAREQQLAGVIAASAGNHAQGVAYAAQKLGIACRIVMPRTTPNIKVEAVRGFGARIDLHGDSYTDAAELAARIEEETGATRIPPFDDLDVIAGQGTVALELLHQAPRDLGSVFIPIGGGGLASGIASVIKELRPEVRVIGVQSVDSDAMRQSLAAGCPVRLDQVGIFADGTAVKQVGELTLDLCRRYLDDCITVTTDELCAAIRDGFQATRTILEPSGALGIAGAKAIARSGQLPAGPVVAIASGANISFAKLGYVSERADVGANREALFGVTIPERPGAFLEFCTVVGDRQVTEFNYRLAHRSEARVFVGVDVGSAERADALRQSFAAAGYRVDELTEDEVAKTHVRHMVGGYSAEARDEVIFTFAFPERPGALLEFLGSLGTRWNISLFHYRNNGSALGRVLCGLEVPLADRAALCSALDALEYEYEDVTETPAVRFLTG